VIQSIVAVNNQSDENARRASKKQYQGLRVNELLTGSGYSVVHKWLRTIQGACLDGNTDLDEATTSRRFATDANKLVFPILNTLKHQLHLLHSGGYPERSPRRLAELRSSYNAAVEYFAKLDEIFSPVLKRTDDKFTLSVYTDIDDCSGRTVEVPVGPWVFLAGKLRELSKDKYQMDNLVKAGVAVKEAVGVYRSCLY
jgi:hypothetical protein